MKTISTYRYNRAPGGGARGALAGGTDRRMPSRARSRTSMEKGWAYEKDAGRRGDQRCEMTEGTGKGKRRGGGAREKEKEILFNRQRCINTARGKSPKRKPLTTSTGWKKNRLRESKRGYVGRFSSPPPLPFFLSLSYSIFPPLTSFLCLRPALSAFMNVSSFLRTATAVSTTRRFHYKTDI